MAKIKDVPKLLKENFKDAPAWFFPVMENFNNLVDVVLNTLRGRVSIEDNIYSEIKTNTHTHGIELEVSFSGGFLGLVVISTPEESDSDYAITGWKVRRINNTLLGITINFSGAGTTSGSVKYLILRS